MIELSCRPEVLAFLSAAKERPEDDMPRLALADWLDERGDAERAEFIRLQCRLAPGSEPERLPDERNAALGRTEALLGRFGGAWLGSLWAHGGIWHRGLLSADFDPHEQVEPLADMLHWIDTARFEVTGCAAFRQAVAVVNSAQLNHICLHLRRPFREDSLLELLTEVRGSPLLRTLTFNWSPGMGAKRPGKPVLGLSDDFFTHLLKALPIGQHLTHLGSGLPLTLGHLECLRNAGVVPVPAWPPHWMHTLPPAVFRR